MRLSRHRDRQPGHRFGHPVFLAVLLLLVLMGLAPGLLAQKGSRGRVVVVTITPDYPETLQRAKIGGVVRLTATVLPNGTVTKVQIRGGNPILAESAAAAVAKWKYAPGPVETSEDVSLNFTAH